MKSRESIVVTSILFLTFLGSVYATQIPTAGPPSGTETIVSYKSASVILANGAPVPGAFRAVTHFVSVAGFKTWRYILHFLSQDDLSATQIQFRIAFGATIGSGHESFVFLDFRDVTLGPGCCPVEQTLSQVYNVDSEGIFIQINDLTLAGAPLTTYTLTVFMTAA